MAVRCTYTVVVIAEPWQLDSLTNRIRAQIRQHPAHVRSIATSDVHPVHDLNHEPQGGEVKAGPLRSSVSTWPSCPTTP